MCRGRERVWSIVADLADRFSLPPMAFQERRFCMAKLGNVHYVCDILPTGSEAPTRRALSCSSTTLACG